MPIDASYLADIQIFNLLDENDRLALAGQLDEISFPAGHMLFKTGEPGDSLLIIRSGEVEVFFNNDTGERIVLETVHAGDVIGELSLLDGGPRTASALVTRDMEGLLLDRDDLEQFLTLRPSAGLDLLASMGRRLRKNAELLRHTAT
ncbi:MAG: cyclic nucleotide-binding domain-containing protein, partial [Anaerolineales bacterium]